LSTAYDLKSGDSYSLNTIASAGYVDITATPAVTATWGTTQKSISTELSFDLQVTIDEDTVWTPLIGTIVVLSDVTLAGAP
jgi:hypothetical protein